MKNKKRLYIIVTIIILIAGMTTVVLYKLGGRIFNEVIDMQISEIEKVMEATESKGTEVTAGKDTETQPPTLSNAQSTIVAQVPAPTQPIGNTEIPSTKPDEAPSQDIQVTKDKLEDIKESVTPSDKMTAATLVLSKLSKSDISHLTELSAGGITPEEKAEMKDIVYNKFTSSEIQKIKELYLRYMK